MQDKKSPVMRFILQALTDDFESVDTLVNYSTASASPTFTQTEIVKALVALIGGGYVQAFLYSEASQKYMPSEFAPTNSEKFWFGLANRNS